MGIESGYTPDQKHPVEGNGAFEKKEKKTIYTPDSILPLSPISGCIFCYVSHQLLNKLVQWKPSNSGNHPGYTAPWQAGTHDEQKNKYRIWTTACFSSSQSTAGGCKDGNSLGGGEGIGERLSAWDCVCVCPCACVYVYMGVFFMCLRVLHNHRQTGPASCPAFLHRGDAAAARIPSRFFGVVTATCG